MVSADAGKKYGYISEIYWVHFLSKSELTGIHGLDISALTYKPGLVSEVFPHPWNIHTWHFQAGGYHKM